MKQPDISNRGFDSARSLREIATDGPRFFIPAVTTFRSLRLTWSEREAGGFQGVVLQGGIESPAVSRKGKNEHHL